MPQAEQITRTCQDVLMETLALSSEDGPIVETLSESL